MIRFVSIALSKVDWMNRDQNEFGCHHNSILHQPRSSPNLKRNFGYNRIKTQGAYTIAMGLSDRSEIRAQIVVLLSAKSLSWNSLIGRLFRAGDFTDRIQGVSSILVACGCQESPNTSRKAFSIAIEEFQTSGTSQKYL